MVYEIKFDETNKKLNFLKNKKVIFELNVKEITKPDYYNNKIIINNNDNINEIVSNYELEDFFEICKTNKIALVFDEKIIADNLVNILKIIIKFNEEGKKEGHKFYNKIFNKLAESISLLKVIEENFFDQAKGKELLEILKLFSNSTMESSANKKILNKVLEFVDKIENNIEGNTYKVDKKEKRDFLYNLYDSLNNIKGAYALTRKEWLGNFIKKYENKICENLPKIISIDSKNSKIEINLGAKKENLNVDNMIKISELIEQGFEFKIPEITVANIDNALIIFGEIINFENKEITEAKKNIEKLLNIKEYQEKVKKTIENLLNNESFEQKSIKSIANFIIYSEEGKKILSELNEKNRKKILELLVKSEEKVSFNNLKLTTEYEKTKLETRIKEFEEKEREDCYEDCKEKISSIKSFFKFLKELLDKNPRYTNEVKEILKCIDNEKTIDNKFDFISEKMNKLLSKPKNYKKPRKILETEEERLENLVVKLKEYEMMYKQYRKTPFFTTGRRELKKAMDENYKYFKQHADFHQKYQRGRLHNFHHGLLGRIATYRYMKSALKTVEKDLEKIREGKNETYIDTLIKDNEDKEKLRNKKADMVSRLLKKTKSKEEKVFNYISQQ